MINGLQLTELIIKPAIADLQMYSDNAVELLIFTCANESLGGTYIKQKVGSALGIYQMEPKTYNDIWQKYIYCNLSIILQLNHNFEAYRMPPEDRLVYDLRFATAMARLHYARVKEPLPPAHDTEALWNYYKIHYNTSAGKAKWNDGVGNYHHFKSNSSL